MPWGPAPLTTLVIPEDAADTDPRTVIGGSDAMPANLVAFYAAEPATIVSGQVTFDGAGSYWYDVFLDPGGGIPEHASGSFLFGDQVNENTRQVGIPYPATEFLSRGDTFTNGLSIAINSPRGSVGDFAVQGISQGYGMIARTASAANTAAIGAETVIATMTTNRAMDPSRVYKFHYRNQLTWTAAATIVVRLRKTNIAGAVVASSFMTRGASGQDPANDANWLTPLAAGTYTFVVTLQATAGTVTAGGGAPEDQRWYQIDDRGSLADFTASGQPSPNTF